MASDTKTPESGTLGWREWLALPDLNILAIKAKIDTGAKTSALHTFRIEPFQLRGADYVRFWIHPLRRRTDIEVACEAPVVDRRTVKDSGGHAEQRYVILTRIRAGDTQWPAEITLTGRDDMLFRMLLGRTALVEGGFKVDPGTSFLLGRKLARSYRGKKRAAGVK